MKKYVQRLKNERGMTLVELLAVIVILAIIATIAFVMIGKVIENSKKDAHIANATQLIASAKLYEATEGTINGSVSYGDLRDSELIDVLLDPWEKTEYTNNDDAKVSVDSDHKYSVVLKDDAGDCEIDNTEEEILELGRTICDGTEGP